MKDSNTGYSKKELKEFEILLNNKLKETDKQLTHLRNSILRIKSGHDSNYKVAGPLEGASVSSEKQNLSQLALRMQRYKRQLEDALVRIKNGTYGFCTETGKLIPKERLKVVPHTQYSIEAKQLDHNNL